MIEQEVLYERKLTGSYMKIAAVDCSKFDERMLLTRKIRGALSVEQCYLNEEAWYWYNISGKQSLDTYCRIRDVGIAFIEKIIISICDEIAILEWSLFDLNCLLLTPEFIFINNLNQEIIFTVYPGGKEELSGQFRELMEYLLTKVDHSDADAVRAAYGIYEKTLDEAYGIMDIRDYIIHNRQEKSADSDYYEENEEHKKNRDYRDPGDNAIRNNRNHRDQSSNLYTNQGIYMSSHNLSSGNPADGETWKQRPYSRNNSGRKNADKQNHEKISSESHKVFPEIMKILNGWKIMFGKERGQNQDVTESSQILRDKGKREVTYKPPVQAPLQVAEEIGQTTCLSSYAAYMQGKLIYMGTENLGSISLPRQDVTIGKSLSADISVDRSTVSQFHAKISFRNQEFYLEDLNSTNGTFVNEEVLPYKEQHRLQVNDIVRFADVSYRFI